METKILLDLTEAQFDDEKRDVIIRVLRTGWSKNERFYTKKAVESLIPHLKQKRHMYLNHVLRNGISQYIGRDFRDVAASIKEAWYDDTEKSAFVRAHIPNDPNGWVYEWAKNDPSLVGVSIDARAIIKEGEMNGKKGDIVEQITQLASVDFVPNPGVEGAQVVRIAASAIEEDDRTKFLLEAFATFFAKNATKRTFGDLFFDLQNYVRSIINDDAKYPTLNDKKKIISKSVDEFKTLLLDLNLEQLKSKPFGFFAEGDDTKTMGDVYEALKEGDLDYTYFLLECEYNISEVFKTDNGMKFSAKAYLVVPDKNKPSTWKLRIEETPGKITQAQLGRAAAALGKGFRGRKVQLTAEQRKSALRKLRGLYRKLNVPEKEWPDVLKTSKESFDNQGGETIVELTKAQLLAEYPDIVEELKNDFLQIWEKQQAESEIVQEKEKLEKELEAKEAENKELQKKLDEYQLREKIAEKKQKIQELLKESSLADEFITEFFVKQLEECEDENEIREAIADREKIVKSLSGKVVATGDTKPVEKNTEENVTVPSDDEAAKLIVGSLLN